mmetsp:Transcript_34090/g.77757  ORF Transcript_34090/g.77757 Transcript_34090/m.77757 type:complete len:172 (-) Transcript_34090:102-617(-)
MSRRCCRWGSTQLVDMNRGHGEADVAAPRSHNGNSAASSGSDYMSFGGARMSGARELNHSTRTGEALWQQQGEAFRFIEDEAGNDAVMQRALLAAPDDSQSADNPAPRQWATCGVTEAGRAGCEETALFLCSRCEGPVCVRHRRFWRGRLCCPTCQNRALRGHEAEVCSAM